MLFGLDSTTFEFDDEKKKEKKNKYTEKAVKRTSYVYNIIYLYYVNFFFKFSFICSYFMICQNRV